MEWIGFLCVLALGIYVTRKGAIWIFENFMFRSEDGVDSAMGFGLLSIGISLLLVAWHFKPFTILIQ